MTLSLPPGSGSIRAKLCLLFLFSSSRIQVLCVLAGNLACAGGAKARLARSLGQPAVHSALLPAADRAACDGSMAGGVGSECPCGRRAAVGNGSASLRLDAHGASRLYVPLRLGPADAVPRAVARLRARVADAGKDAPRAPGGAGSVRAECGLALGFGCSAASNPTWIFYLGLTFVYIWCLYRLTEKQ